MSGQSRLTQAPTLSPRLLHKCVLGFVSLWFLFVATFAIAYWRVSNSDKYSGKPFKSLTWQESQKQNSLSVKH